MIQKNMIKSSNNNKTNNSQKKNKNTEKTDSYKVYDAMTTNPVTISENITVQQAAQKMEENKVGSLLIKKGLKVVGILTERDVTRKLAAKNLSAKNTLSKEIMSKELYTINPKADIQDAMKLMGDINKRQLPVVDENQELVGMLTLKDVLKIQPQLIGLIHEKLRVKEEDRKPVYQSENEGICQICGNYSFALVENDGIFVCSDCKEMEE